MILRNGGGGGGGGLSTPWQTFSIEYHLSFSGTAYIATGCRFYMKVIVDGMYLYRRRVHKLLGIFTEMNTVQYFAKG